MSPPDDYRYTYFDPALVSIPHKLGHQYHLLQIIFEYYLQFYPHNRLDLLPVSEIPVFWNALPKVTREIVSNGEMGHETEPFSWRAETSHLWRVDVTKKQLSDNFYLPSTNLNNLVTIKIEIQLPRGLEFLQSMRMTFNYGRLYFDTRAPKEVVVYPESTMVKRDIGVIWCKVDSSRQVSNKRHIVDGNENEIDEKEIKDGETQNVQPKSTLSMINITYEIKGLPEILLSLDKSWSQDMKQGFMLQNNNTIQCKQSGNVGWGQERDHINDGDPIRYCIENNQTRIGVHTNTCNG